MTPWPEEIAASVRGAIRLFFWDERALEDFNLTIEGFWRSFAAPLALIPLYLFFFTEYRELVEAIARLDPDFAAETQSLSSDFGVSQIITYVFGILTAPLFLVFLSRFLEFTDRYVQTVVALNWGHVVAVCLFLIPILMHSFGVATPTLAGSALTFAFLIALAYQFAVLRIATECSFPVTALVLAALALVDVIVGLLVGFVYSAVG